MSRGRSTAVTSKPILPPSNNSQWVHPRRGRVGLVPRSSLADVTLHTPRSDYASLRPYYWPDCSSVGNTTELTDEQSEK
jgi:hypothetical protein